VLIERWDLILLVTFITIVGKGISTFLGALLSGENRKQAFQAGMSLAQIGEFSFIIASLGVTLKVTSDFLYPLAIATSAVTTFTTPYLIKVSEPVFRFVDARMPESMKAALDRYHASFGNKGRERIGTLLFKSYGLKIILNTVVVIAIIGAFKGLLIGEVQEYLAESSWAGSVSLLLCLLLCAPFMWGIVMSGPSLRAQREVEELQKLKGLQAGLFVGRVVLALLLLSAILSQFVNLRLASGVVLGVLVLAVVSGQFWVRRLYQFIEKNFLKNLTEKERQELINKEVVKNILPWEASLGSYDISANSRLAGKTLRELSFKENYDVTVAAIFRGSQRLFAPDGDCMVWPYDKILCFGSEEELQKFHSVLEEERTAGAMSAEESLARQEDFKLDSFVIRGDSEYRGKTIRESGIRDKLRGMVVGVERGTQRILGPTGSFELRENDLVWFVTDRKML